MILENGCMTEHIYMAGVHKIYHFENNYGASIVKHPYSYGYEDDCWELAVIMWTGSEWRICYSTAITDDVIGYLDTQEVEEILEKIKAL